MIIERIVYCLVCLILFGYIIKKYLNSKSGMYLSLMAIQFVCLVTQLIAFCTQIYVDGFMQVYILLFNIIIPAAIFASDYLNVNFEEFVEIKLGDFFARHNKYDKAIEKYKKALSKNTNNAQTFAKLGRIYNAKGDRRTAFDRFARAIELDRNDYRSYYEIGVIFNDMGKHADAQIVLDNALRIKPDFTPASELLAVVLCAQNKYDEAINVYKNATRYDPDNYQLYYRMGVVRTELRDFNDAKECYEKAIELNPSLYQAYFSLGQINLLKGELSQAEKMFKKAMVSKDLTAKSYYQLAKVYILNDEEIKSVTYLGYAIDIDSSYKYKAESEPLFAKIKDYITGLSMANRVMQQAEIYETLKQNENNFEEDVDINPEVEDSTKADEEDYIEEQEDDRKLKNNDDQDLEEDDDYSFRENGEAKENKFFKMMKSVLGFDESFEKEDSQEIEEDNYENNCKNNENNSDTREYSYEEEYVVRHVKEAGASDEYSIDVDEESEMPTKEEIDRLQKEINVEGSSTLDIFEKFKKLKKEEDEKAERLRRIQKMKQLEELKKQEQKESKEDYKEEYKGTYFSDSYKKEIYADVDKSLSDSESEENANFENEDTMDEPHFDFMDRFKRR